MMKPGGWRQCYYEILNINFKIITATEYIQIKWIIKHCPTYCPSLLNSGIPNKLPFGLNLLGSPASITHLVLFLSNS